MANKFRLHCELLDDTSETTLVTASDTSICIINSLIVTNIHATNSGDITLTITDTSAGSDFDFVINETLASEVSQEVLSRPLILANLDILKATASAGNVFNIFVSYLERTRD